MTQVKPNLTKETDVPQIPEPTPGNLLAVVRAIKEVLEVREGLTGDPLDQLLTVRDMYAMGSLPRSAVNRQIYARVPGYGLVFLPAAQNVTPEYAPPPAATGFSAVGALANVILTWDKTAYHGHSFTEVWRAGADNLTLAVLVGTTDSNLYADNLGQTGLTRYYWIRHISQTGVPGKFNATAGTSATTGLIVTGDITDASITTQKIADGAVVTVKLGDASVVSTKLADSSVVTAKIGDLAVTTQKIGDASITKVKFGTNLSPVEKVALLPPLPDANYPQGWVVLLSTDNKLYRSTGTAWTAAVPTADLTGQITEVQITDSAISTPKLAANAVTAVKIAAATITSAEIAADTIVAGNIAAAAIGATELATASVVAGKIAANAIVAADGVIAAAAIETAQIQNAAITNAKIGNLAVDAAKIADASIVNAKIADLAVTSAKIDNLAVTQAKIGALAVGAAQIADAAITNVKILDATIQGAKIANATITGALLVAGTITGDKISSTTTITAGSLNDVAVLDGAHLTYRIYAGNADPALAPFSVQKNGTVTIRNATTGARLEVMNNVIKVFDAGGTLRVKLGDLA